MNLIRKASVAAALLTTLFLNDARAEDRPLFRPLGFQALSGERAGAFGADFYFDNHDRDPQGIDVFDVGFRFRYQVADHTELFASFVADRVISLPEAPAIPSAPRDLLFVGSIVTVPNAFNGEFPYLDKRGDARFSAMIPGPATIGFTRSFGDATGLPAFGFSASLVIPMAGSIHALRSGAGSGRPDSSFAALFGRELLGGRLHGRAGYTITGKGRWADQSFTQVGSTVTKVVTKTPIGNRFDAGLAWVRPLTDTSAISLEARFTKEFVGEERIDAVSPLDLILGLHKAFGRWTVSASVLDHLRPLPSGAVRANPLAGAIDLSNVGKVERNAFLARIGFGGTLGDLRDDAHIVVVGSNSGSLPAGAVRIPATYNIRSEHNLGYVFNLSFRP